MGKNSPPPPLSTATAASADGDRSETPDGGPKSPSITPCRGQVYEMDCHEYFATTPAPPCVQPAEQQLDEFLKHATKRPIVLVTSGGTTVPLEQQTVRFLDNFSAGTRGATSAEHFLRAGYSVVFMHRQYSLRPFSRHYTHSRETIFDLLEMEPGSGVVKVRADLEHKARELLAEYHRFVTQDKALLSIEFTTVADYLFLLRMCVQRIHQAAGPRALYYLAAAVSDFFLPLHKMVEHKIQSRGGALALTLDPVPKTLRTFVGEWAPGGFTVSFKLETDPAMLEKKSKQALDRYGHQLVIGNMLKTRKFIVYFFSLDGDKLVTDTIELSKEEQAKTAEIEAHMIPKLVDLHSRWIQKHSA
ncbi:DNA/pantothenate metabolism flavo protein [Catenaria anguillulae PL171]|uniref:DNA/pantothenate metabolism flavo protein n=1 Tax=Catenaria anguillulae PL171 TaxID=765915 RepID=A0A1Y2I3C9_9FUNG|nr:DNA/pantothenate metabolism flavo protein [Catenaria anguillulae PL171]